MNQKSVEHKLTSKKKNIAQLFQIMLQFFTVPFEQHNQNFDSATYEGFIFFLTTKVEIHFVIMQLLYINKFEIKIEYTYYN